MHDINIATSLCNHFPVLSLETHLKKVWIPIISLHADTFKTSQDCDTFGQTFLTMKVSIEG